MDELIHNFAGWYGKQFVAIFGKKNAKRYMNLGTIALIIIIGLLVMWFYPESIGTR